MATKLKRLNDVITQCHLIDQMMMDGTYDHAQGDHHYMEILYAVGDMVDFEDEEVRRHLDWYYDALLDENIDELRVAAFYLISILVKMIMTEMED